MRLRPLARRRRSTSRPPRVFLRARKPWVRLRLLLCGWYVRFDIAWLRSVRNADRYLPTRGVSSNSPTDRPHRPPLPRPATSRHGQGRPPERTPVLSGPPPAAGFRTENLTPSRPGANPVTPGGRIPDRNLTPSRPGTNPVTPGWPDSGQRTPPPPSSPQATGRLRIACGNSPLIHNVTGGDSGVVVRSGYGSKGFQFIHLSALHRRLPVCYRSPSNATPDRRLRAWVLRASAPPDTPGAHVRGPGAPAWPSACGQVVSCMRILPETHQPMSLFLHKKLPAAPVLLPLLWITPTRPLLRCPRGRA